MLKKMRRRFIAAAMAAIFAVTLLLLLAVNIWNYNITTERLDSTLDAMSVWGGAAAYGEPDYPLAGIFGDRSPEARYMTRYFWVQLDTNRNTVRVFSDYIASVTAAEAAQDAADVIDSGRQQGYSGEYRYAVSSGSGYYTVVFLNASQELQAMRTLLIVSCVTAGLSLLLMFALVSAFSRRAIEPYVKNIELQKQFITDAGHELKTPLTSISTSADVLALADEDNEWVDNIRRQCRRLSKLVTNLVTLSRLDEGVPLPDKAEFSLSDAAWEASDPFTSLADARGLRFERSIEDSLSLVGDRALVQQMISILLDNAFKYCDPGGSISLRIYRHRKNCVIEAYNTCDPAALTDIDRFFDRFYRADKSRSGSGGGTGVGLSIARAAAEAHGGSINAKTADGKSITFTAVLP